MEKEIKLKTKDGRVIYGTLNSQKNNKKLLIVVHGLMSSIIENPYFSASRFFPKHGFDAFRIELYSGNKKARKLKD
ncbi:MAG: hypothetical protein HY513_00470 [Candidatus Aenigmarchaeota archaeon]|nr:hypothetical protein [Candidatus Aenigmarchaeota archaeon]